MKRLDEHDRGRLEAMMGVSGWTIYTELVLMAIESERRALESETNSTEMFRRQGAILGLRAALDLAKRSAVE